MSAEAESTFESFGPRIIAAADLLGRTGAETFKIWFCDEHEPTVWIAAVLWGETWQASGGTTPEIAVFSLCDKVIDGGTCTHCQKRTAFDADPGGSKFPSLGLCWYRYDPELTTFRRSCEGIAG